jgi:hypothetical protein
VRHWFRRRGPGRRPRASINAVGAVATALVGAIVIATKFTEGAWAVVVSIPLLVLVFLRIGRHYDIVSRRLRRGAIAVQAEPVRSSTVLLYVERLDPATQAAYWYARSIAPGKLRAIHVPFPGSDAGIKARFSNWAHGDPQLEILETGEHPVDAVLDVVWALPHGENDFVTMVLPELFRRPSLIAAFLHRTTFSLKVQLLAEPGLVVTDVPRVVTAAAPVKPRRVTCIVPVDGVTAASVRALRYAQTLGLADTRAVFLAFEEEQAEQLRKDWAQLRLDLPLEILQAELRDLGGPLLARIRQITDDPEAVAVVVIPELVVRGTSRLLHKHYALYLKRLLLFEPQVIVACVPYQLLT